MKKIKARTLLDYHISTMWETLHGEFVLVFDDGVELLVDAKTTLYSLYAWEFHRRYPDTPLLAKHHLRYVLGDRRLGSGTHTELLGNVMWSTYDAYANQYQDYRDTRPTQQTLDHQMQLRDTLSELIYRTTNAIYVDLSHRAEEYVVSLDITDFLAVMNHPVIAKANNDLRPNQKSIDECYRTIKKVLQNPAELTTNPIALAARSKLINVDQVMQCVSARGYLTDTNSQVFRKPIMRGYVQGIRYFEDSLKESRSAAKSLIFSKSPLQDAEYFSRRLQLVSQNVRNLHPGDCGSTNYMAWKIRSTTIEDGVVSEYDDLRNTVGKYYMDDDGVLKVVKAGDKHLIGRTLQVRSVRRCIHPDPYGFCATCFGELSLSVPANTNIGHMCATSMTQRSTQSVMSVKHSDGSSVVEGIILGPDDRRFLSVSTDENSYLLAPRLANAKVTLVIPPDRAANITDIVEAVSVENLNEARVSELAEIEIVTEIDNIEERTVIGVNIGRRLASMTYPLLRHIRSKGWGVDEKGNYTIDMEGFDFNETILVLPLKHINMSDHSRDIAKLLESTVDELQERDVNISPDALLVEFYDLVNDKLTVNLAVLEVILYGMLIVSAEKNDYSLPKPWTDCGVGIMSLSMTRRSASAMMAYEGHREFITSPTSYIYTNRLNHPMDWILCPADVQRSESLLANNKAWGIVPALT